MGRYDFQLHVHVLSFLKLASYKDYRSSAVIWEQFNQRSAWPDFMDTMEEELPWTTPSVFTTSLLQHTEHLAHFYRADPWHAVNLGVGKSWGASALVLLLENFFVEGSLDQRLQQLSIAYVDFCKTSVAQLVQYREF